MIDGIIIIGLVEEAGRNAKCSVTGTGTGTA